MAHTMTWEAITAMTSQVEFDDVTTDTESTSSKNNADDDTNESEVISKVIEVLFVYVYPILVICGMLANVLIIVVITRPKNRKLSTFLNILVLATCDSLVLFLDFINNFFKSFLGIPTIGFNSVVCVLYRWAFVTLFMFSAWIVVITTVQRLVVIWRPFEAYKSSSSKKKSGFILLGFFVACALFNLYNVFAWTSRENNCDFADGWEYFLTNQSAIIVYTLYSYIPSIILLVSNSIIIKIIRKAGEKKLSESDPSKKQGMSRSMQVTRTVLSISFTFLCLTVPVSVFFIYQVFTGQHIDMSETMFMFETIFLLLALSNHSVNFIIYIATIESFRADCRRMMLFWRKEGGSQMKGLGGERPGSSHPRAKYEVDQTQSDSRTTHRQHKHSSPQSA